MSEFDETMELDVVKVGDRAVAVPMSAEEAASTVAMSRPRGRDRRKAERIRLDADVSLYSPTQFWAGLAEDLSEGGLFVATYQLEPIGTPIDLRFELPTGQAVQVRGVVRWVREITDESMPGMGVQFEDVESADLRVIQTFVKHRPPLLWDTE